MKIAFFSLLCLKIFIRKRLLNRQYHPNQVLAYGNKH